jgi:hypothetical protein
MKRQWDDAGIGFASGNWRRAVTGRAHPGMVVRKHLEAMVFTYLAAELRTGGQGRQAASAASSSPC